MTFVATILAVVLPAPAEPPPLAEPAARPRPALTYSRHGRRRARRQLEAARWYLRRHRATRPYRGWLASTRWCESRGDYGAIGGGGLYRGAYQFDFGTWYSVGGRGDPAAAPEIEQDFRAVLLYQRRGSAPWPICG